jgi:hypothetical protein
MKEAVLIGAYTDSIEKELTLIQTILGWKKYNLPIILSTHYPVSEKIQNLVDYYIYDKEQYLDPILVNQRYYMCSFFNIWSNWERPSHAAAVVVAYQNALKLLGHKFDFIYMNDYDVELDKQVVLDIVRPLQNSNYGMFVFDFGLSDSYATNVFFFKPNTFNKIWGRHIESVNDYMNLVYQTGKFDHILELVFYNLIKSKHLEDSIFVFDQEQKEKIVIDFNKHYTNPRLPQIFVSSTTDNEAVLFLVNESPNILPFQIKTRCLLTNEEKISIQNIDGNLGMYWSLFKNVYLEVSCQDIKKSYYIDSYNTFAECQFKFNNDIPIFMKK